MPVLRHVFAALFLLVLVPACPARAQGDIVLGMSAAFSGPTRGLGIELYRGAQACFAEVNAAGGVHGRRIVIRALDDRYSPGPAIENTITFAEQGDVFALFGQVGTPTATRVLPLLRRYQGSDLYLLFPLTGAEPLRQPPYARWVFNLRASYAQEARGLVDNFVRQGRTRIAVLHQGDAYGRAGWDGVRKALARFDLTIVAEASHARDAGPEADMGPQVDILARGRPDAVVAVGSSEACAAFIRQARDAGLSVPVAVLSFAGAERLTELLAHAGAAAGRDYTADLALSQAVPSHDDPNLPAAAAYRHAADRFAPPPPPTLVGDGYRPLPYSLAAFEGYLGARLFVEALRRMGPDPHPRLLPEALRALAGQDLGMGEPVAFGPDSNQALTRVHFITVERGRLTPLHDFTRWRK